MPDPAVSKITLRQFLVTNLTYLLVHYKGLQAPNKNAGVSRRSKG